MKDQFNVFKHFWQETLVRHTAVNEIEIAADFIKVFAVACREIVEHANACAVVYECGSYV